MKKIMMIGLVLAVAVVAGACAAVTPKLYVPESELPKTKFVVVETTTYEKFEAKDGELIFSNPTNEEYGEVFKKAFKKELKKRGFVAMSITSNKENSLLIKVSLANKLPTVPFLTAGAVFLSAIVKNGGGKIIWRFDAATLTNSFYPASYMVRIKTAPELAKHIAEDFRNN